MTRRSLVNVLISGAAGTLACVPKGAAAALKNANDMAEREGLAIIMDRSFANTVTGVQVGQLRLPDNPYWLSVAPDGAAVAWVPASSLCHPLAAEEPLVRFTDKSRSVRTLRFAGRCATQVAISSNARHVALIAVADEAFNRRLMLLNPVTAEVEYDSTELISRFDRAQVECFQISATGDRLAVASRESFAVIDLPSRKLVLEGNGRFTSLSPQGDALVFLGRGGDLVMITLATGARRSLMNRWWTAFGVGGWSPDGRFLLAGGEASLGIFTKLVVIDCTTNEFVEIMRLGHGNGGQTCRWIKRSLLSG
jgi:hypothetical protein